MRYIVVLIGLSLIAIFARTTLRSAPFPDPTPRKEAIMKLFVNEFVPLTPGKGKFPRSFQMGSAKGLESEQPVHTVTFRYSFSMAKYEVTQELYYVVMGGNPSKWKGARNSVEVTDWNDATMFCKKVTKELRKRKLIKNDEEIRLPSEAEWEYACRAGTKTDFSFGNDLEQLTHYAWYKGNSKGHDPPVGKKKPNPWGLYDMHGYIWEWCADTWHENYRDAPTDGSARQTPSKKRVIRSGSWADLPERARSTFRMSADVTEENDRIGFRCVKAVVKK